MLKTVGFPSTRTGDQTIVSGNLVIGTAGKGIDFSANPNPAGMTSEILNDYEEGTWTPTDASGAALTFANVSAFYTKVGRQVFAHYYFTYPTTVDVTANAVGGLPFTASNVNAARGGSAVTYNEMNAFISIYGPRNGTAWQYVNGVGNGYTNAQLSGKTFMGCITYFV
jgi:hypothetical protein